jgi:hypothetical protein
MTERQVDTDRSEQDWEIVSKVGVLFIAVVLKQSYKSKQGNWPLVDVFRKHK